MHSTTPDLSNDSDFYEAYKSHCQIVASSIRRTYRLSKTDEEDLAQSMSMKLLRIPLDKRSFPAYVRTCLNNCARDEISRLLRHEHRYLPATIEAASHSDFDSQHRVDDLLSCLTAMQRSIIVSVLGLDGPVSSLRAVAKSLGIRNSQAQTEMNAALQLMRSRAERN